MSDFDFFDIPRMKISHVQSLFLFSYRCEEPSAKPASKPANEDKDSKNKKSSSDSKKPAPVSSEEGWSSYLLYILSLCFNFLFLSDFVFAFVSERLPEFF